MENLKEDTPKSCLFSAPHQFLSAEIKDEYQETMPTLFREIWDKNELFVGEQISAWVVNPGQRFVVGADVLSSFPNLDVVVTPSTGTNHIDINECKKNGIAVFGLLDNRKCLDTITASAEFSFLLLLNTLRRVDVAAKEVTEGRWRHREDLLRGNELTGKKVGIVGFGRIGKKLARYCEAFDAHISYCDPYVDDDSYPNLALEQIFEQNDVVCIACTLTPETTGFINGTLLARLSKNACLINTSRGEVINEYDLADILRKRDDIRVGLDVIAGEVTDTQFQSPLIEFHGEGRIVITPHIAGAAVESQTKAARCAFELLKAHINS